MNKLWLNASLIYLFIVVLLGSFLRWMGFESFGINYSHLLHTHSHIAFLGWIYNLLIVILLHTFLTPEKRISKPYQIQFWFAQIANTGMLLSFQVQGYGFYSIAFSTLHIIFSFCFAYQFLKDAKFNSDNFNKHFLSFKFIKAGIFFMVLSSIGPLSMGPIIAIKGSGSNLYYNAIYFYLHFQYTYG